MEKAVARVRRESGESGGDEDGGKWSLGAGIRKHTRRSNLLE